MLEHLESHNERATVARRMVSWNIRVQMAKALFIATAAVAVLVLAIKHF